MTKTTERRISHWELHVVAIRCKGCGGEVRIDFDVEGQRASVVEGAVMKCPVCGHDFDSEVSRAFKCLNRMRGHLAEVEQEFVFCVEDSCD